MLAKMTKAKYNIFNKENGELYANRVITITRPKESEIDLTIKDLTTRGFEVVDRGSYKRNIFYKVYWVKLKCVGSTNDVNDIKQNIDMED